MALYLLKPILWNTNKYVIPSGVRAAADSFPGKYGFGHEEWNNSPRMEFTESGVGLRAFHTEGIKNAPVDEHAGQTFVLMIASHDGIQQLVGVACNAIYLGKEKDEAERKRIAQKLKLKELWRDVWALESVRHRFNDDPAGLRRIWSQDVGWVPNWVCPSQFFMWLDKPVTLDPLAITGSGALPKMFTSYKALDRETAAVVMNAVPKAERTATWARILDAMRSAPDEPVPQQPEGEDDRASSRLAMIQARIGQGQFRQAQMQRWGNCCAVTGLGCPELLRASHIKPWTDSTRREKLDPNNGLLLAAHLDALFDKGLISFDDKGKMLLSSRLGVDERAHFGLPKKLRVAPDAAQSGYLAHHRDRLFDRKPG